MFHSVTCTAAFAIVSVSDTKPDEIKSRSSGLQSIYRYDCDDESVNCTPLDDYVWRNNDDYEYKVDAVYDHPDDRKLVIRRSSVL